MTLFEIDPNSVISGWMPLVMTAILAAAMVLLFLSMRKQVRRIDVPDSTDATLDDSVDRPQDERVESPRQ